MELIVPNNLSEITLKQYQRFLKIQEKETDENFLRCKMIEIFCNIDAKTVRKMKLSDAEKITSILSDMFEQKPQLVQTFKLGDVNYGFIPDLDEISLGEYIDLDTHISQWDKMHVAMNVLYRPIKEQIKDKYTIVPYDTTNEPLDEIPMDVVFGSIFFFYNLGIDLSQTMMNYLEEEGDSPLMEHLTSTENGVGIKASMVYLKEMLQDLKISLN